MRKQAEMLSASPLYVSTQPLPPVSFRSSVLLEQHSQFNAKVRITLVHELLTDVHISECAMTSADQGPNST